MGKILLVIVGIALVYLLMKNYARRLRNRAPAADRQAEDMVKCDHCGLNLPRSESVDEAGRFFCSAEHAKLRRP
jgi:uncharacterized protein